jgi:hypothetical protein
MRKYLPVIIILLAMTTSIYAKTYTSIKELPWTNRVIAERYNEKVYALFIYDFSFLIAKFNTAGVFSAGVEVGCGPVDNNTQFLLCAGKVVIRFSDKNMYIYDSEELLDKRPADYLDNSIKRTVISAVDQAVVSPESDSVYYITTDKNIQQTFVYRYDVTRLESRNSSNYKGDLLNSTQNGTQVFYIANTIPFEGTLDRWKEINVEYSKYIEKYEYENFTNAARNAIIDYEKTPDLLEEKINSYVPGRKAALKGEFDQISAINPLAVILDRGSNKSIPVTVSTNNNKTDYLSKLNNYNTSKNEFLEQFTRNDQTQIADNLSKYLSDNNNTGGYNTLETKYLELQKRNFLAAFPKENIASVNTRYNTYKTNEKKYTDKLSEIDKFEARKDTIYFTTNITSELNGYKDHFEKNDTPDVLYTNKDDYKKIFDGILSLNAKGYFDKSLDYKKTGINLIRTISNDRNNEMHTFYTTKRTELQTNAAYTSFAAMEQNEFFKNFIQQETPPYQLFNEEEAKNYFRTVVMEPLNTKFSALKTARENYVLYITYDIIDDVNRHITDSHNKAKQIFGNEKFNPLTYWEINMNTKRNTIVFRGMKREIDLNDAARKLEYPQTFMDAIRGKFFPYGYSYLPLCPVIYDNRCYFYFIAPKDGSNDIYRLDLFADNAHVESLGSLNGAKILIPGRGGIYCIAESDGGNSIYRCGFNETDFRKIQQVSLTNGDTCTVASDSKSDYIIIVKENGVSAFTVGSTQKEPRVLAYYPVFIMSSRADTDRYLKLDFKTGNFTGSSIMSVDSLSK